MRVHLSKRADREMLRIAKRWGAKATYPGVFLDELTEIFRLLEATPDLGLVYKRKRGREIRVVLLTKSRYHVYYSVKGDVIEVHSIWGGVRESGPSL